MLDIGKGARMKYWYLKGADVVGPLPVGEIVNDAEFSADTFVCPEHESENSEAWKPAEQYMQDFGYFLDPSHYAKPSEDSPAPKEPNEEKEDIPSKDSSPLGQSSQTSTEERPFSEHSLNELPQGENLSDVKPIFSEGEKALPEGGEPLFEPKPIIEDLPKAYAEQEKEESPLPEEKAPTEYNVYTERVNLNDLPAESEASMEETIHARSPLNAAMDDNLLDEIPAAAVLGNREENIEQALKEPSDDIKGEEAEVVFNEEETLAKEESSSPDKIFKEESSRSEAVVVAPEEGEASSVKEENSNPNENPGRKILREEQAKAAAIKDEEDADDLDEPETEREESDDSLETFTSSAPVVHIDPEDEQSFKNKVLPRATITEDEGDGAEREEEDYFEDSEKRDILSIDDEKEYGVHSSPNHGIIEENHEVDTGLLSVQDSVNSQFVKPAPTTSGKIISSSDGRVREPKNKRNDLIYIMVMFMVVLVIVALMMMFTSEQSKEGASAKGAQTQQASAGAMDMEDQISRSVIQGIDEGMASPEVPFASAPIKNGNLTQNNGSVQDTTQDMARYCENLVRNYRLADGTTIDERFGKIYGADYQTRWGSNLLHGNTYVVEFFASKVRSEPIRYMFSVNASNGEIGGMNNAAVDLVGK